MWRVDGEGGNATGWWEGPVRYVVLSSMGGSRISYAVGSLMKMQSSVVPIEFGDTSPEQPIACVREKACFKAVF